MCLPWCLFDVEVVHRNLLAHMLKPSAWKVEKILLENAFQRSVIGEDEKGGEAFQNESTLLDSPYDG